MKTPAIQRLGAVLCALAIAMGLHSPAQRIRGIAPPSEEGTPEGRAEIGALGRAAEIDLPAGEEVHLPLEGYLVALDAGHGGWSPGAEYEKILEKDIDLAIVLRAAELLGELGCDVYLIREDDSFVDVNVRGDMANAAGADLFVSVHANASDVSSSYNGIYTYYYPGRTESKAFAKVIQSSVVEATGGVDRGLLSERLAALGKNKMPSVLIEVGFMSNHEELMRLVDPDYQDKLAQGIVQGIEDYLIP